MTFKSRQWDWQYSDWELALAYQIRMEALTTEGETMGYFSNGTEGQSYEEQYCSKCVHNYQGDVVGKMDGQDVHVSCPVWALHMEHNYAECNKEGSFLDVLIPKEDDGIWNKQCAMFIDRRHVERHGQADLIARSS